MLCVCVYVCCVCMCVCMYLCVCVHIMLEYFRMMCLCFMTTIKQHLSVNKPTQTACHVLLLLVKRISSLLPPPSLQPTQHPECTVDDFTRWILTYYKMASFSQWLLNDDSRVFTLEGEGKDPPTFHQTLAELYQCKLLQVT